MPSLSCRTALMALLLCVGACAPQPETSLEITVLTTADIHGRVLPWDYYRDQQDEAHSLLKAASLIAVRRDTAEHVLLLDAGDFIQGNPFADFHATERAEDGLHPLLRVMDAMDYDAIVLGNHEFNFGLDYLDRQISLSSSPILAGNVYRHGTREHAYTPYVIRELGGVRVGIIGLTTPGSAVWDRRPAEDALPGRHDARHLRAPGFYCPAGGPGAEAAGQPHSLPWGVRAQQPLPGTGHSGEAWQG